MISSRVELIVRRRLVQAFIDASPTTVTFIRPGEKVKTAAGGYIPGDGLPLSPQKVFIGPSKRRYDTGIINSEAGHIIETELLLMGNYTLDVKVNDIFSTLGNNYFVKSVHPWRSSGIDGVESVLCAIDLRGPNNG